MAVSHRSLRDPGGPGSPCDGGQQCDPDLPDEDHLLHLLLQPQGRLLQGRAPPQEKLHGQRDPPRRLQSRRRALHLFHLWRWTVTCHLADHQGARKDPQ